MGIAAEAQVSQEVADLFALVKPHTDNPMRETVPQELLLEDARLGIGSIHNRDLSRTRYSRREEPLDLGCDIACFFVLVIRLEDNDALADIILGKQAFLLAHRIRGDQAASGLEDSPG